MPRWPEDSRDRLVDASLMLFIKHGYAEVTVDQIAAQAGVSARTFFRYFPDKEEVLFADDDELLPTLLAAIHHGAPELTAEEDMARALTTLAEGLHPQRAQLASRQQIIDAHLALSGRELAKQARWQQSVMDALTARGYGVADADLLASVGFAIFRRALHSWLAETTGPNLATRIRSALPRVRTVLDATARPSA
jgi:AcrR family transcriptional regulator